MNTKNLLKYNVALLIFFTAFASCKKKGNDNPLPQPVETSTADVYAAGLDQDLYVAGYSQTSNGSLATYWKNGNAVSLTDGTSDALIRKIVVVKK
ncbi:MAG: hypothetical protein V4594_12945 [Bacteroidota bacterium]